MRNDKAETPVLSKSAVLASITTVENKPLKGRKRKKNDLFGARHYHSHNTCYQDSGITSIIMIVTVSGISIFMLLLLKLLNGNYIDMVYIWYDMRIYFVELTDIILIILFWIRSRCLIYLPIFHCSVACLAQLLTYLNRVERNTGWAQLNV